jgi:hypothetical protein
MNLDLVNFVKPQMPHLHIQLIFASTIPSNNPSFQRLQTNASTRRALLQLLPPVPAGGSRLRYDMADMADMAVKYVRPSMKNAVRSVS